MRTARSSGSVVGSSYLSVLKVAIFLAWMVMFVVIIKEQYEVRMKLISAKGYLIRSV